ncbi:MAG: hypothetical protein U0Z75_10175 [Deinococcaceae bacterium]
MVLKGWFLVLLSLASYALAHSEPVRVEVRLQASGAIELHMTGKNSNLPILQAEISVSLLENTDQVLQKVPFQDLGRGHYRAKFPKSLEQKPYTLHLTDTTFKGENAQVLVPVQWRGQTVEAWATLPKTNTPTPYLIYALLGLLIPSGVIGSVFLFSWLDKKGKMDGTGPSEKSQ